MDKKNLIIGVLLLAGAFISLYVGQMLAPPPPPAPELTERATGPSPLGSDRPVVPESTTPGDAAFAALAPSRGDATVTTLSNDYVDVQFTDFGGAVQEVAFRRYAAERGGEEPFVFNAQRVEPMLAITNLPGLGADTRYELVRRTANEVVYRTVWENRLEVTRRYVLPAAGAPGDPYRIRHETTLRNVSDSTVAGTLTNLSLGTASLVTRNDPGIYLNLISFDGEDTTYTDRGELDGGGFLAFFGLADGTPKLVAEKPGAVVWAAVKNQFFASIYTGEQPGVATVTRLVKLPPFPGSTTEINGLAGAARYELPAIAPGAEAVLAGGLYVGPKEYTRLREFEQKESKVMQFDRYFFNRIAFSGVLAPLMNLLMNTTHSWVGNWGVAIVLMTLLLKIVTLPFTLAASKSAKRMQKLQPQMQAVREKYKDNPQKLNQATIQIFRDNKVNPMGGCIPILITIPLFIAFFAMLQGTAELRFQGFLWVKDLSAPDTVARIWGIPINIMPLLMGGTMMWQMRLTPTPTTDNMQMQIFKFMPIVFTLICYNFAAALALYSTINGLFTIVQQVLVNKYTKDTPPPVSPGGTANAAAGALHGAPPPGGKGRKRRR